MPWKELSVDEQRMAMVQRVVRLQRPVAAVAREFGVSPKTAFKWLKRYRQNQPLVDQSRRPRGSPARTTPEVEQQVEQLRRRHNWGARKIHRLLQEQELSVPSVRTVSSILRRRRLLVDASSPPEAQVLSFERSAANELWQLDYKGPIEVARTRIWPLSVLDDHSRYCLCFARSDDVRSTTTWELLWDVFGRYGLPESLLCDNAFSAPVGLSWFDTQLVRLNVRPIHGRPHHPQTQGKVERFHGTIKRELLDFNARRDSFEHFDQDVENYRRTYNLVRPHEALGDQPPVTRWQRSTRPRPPTLPEVNYPAGSITRRVSHGGDFRYRNARIVVGRALHGQQVRIQERAADVAVYYSWKLIRVISHDLLKGKRSDKIV
jgi:transposase InsO family protein